MAMAFEIVIDCNDVERATDFWAAALGYERFAEAANYRSIVDPEGHRPKLLLQGVPDPKQGKNRVHLDLQALDIEGEAARLAGFGATRVSDRPVDEHGVAWIVMTDPDGNEFCVCQA